MSLVSLRGAIMPMFTFAMLAFTCIPLCLHPTVMSGRHIVAWRSPTYGQRKPTSITAVQPIPLASEQNRLSAHALLR